MNFKTILLLVVLILGLGGVAYFLSIKGDDCSFSSKKRSLGIDLEAGLSDVKAIKGKVGISDDQVRDFDDLGKDLAAEWPTIRELIVTSAFIDADHKLISNQKARDSQYAVSCSSIAGVSRRS